MSPEWSKLQNTILADFEKEAKETGVTLSGTFNIYNSGSTIVNPVFAYDTNSRAILLELIMYLDAVGDLPYWRTISGVNVVLSLAQKNTLYDLLRSTYFIGLATANAAIDAL